MALYCYKKEYISVKKQVAHKASYISLVAGAFILFWSFYPIISFEIYSRLFIQNSVVSPIPSTEIASSLQSAEAVLGRSDVFSSNLKDFVNAKLWFPTKADTTVEKKIAVTEYTLAIPKLNITEARVLVGGEDLAQSLIHYLPQTLPGEYGNVSIFGHSTLPALYNVKNYKSIFTYLPSLEKGDSVIVKMPEAEYEYEVYDMFVVKPDNVSVLDQKYDDSYLTLITCVPPGTYWNRLIVRAKLKSMPQSL